MAELPEIRYADCDGRDVAYQVMGSGAVPFAGYFDLGVHLDLMWTDPAWVQQTERFGELWRVVFFQMRGIGLSEPVDRRPTLEEQASDLAVVMDAAGLPRAQVLASGATAPGAVVFAALYPDRVDGLVLNCPYLSMPLADDPDLTGWEPGAARSFADWWLENVERWGSGIIGDGVGSDARIAPVTSQLRQARARRGATAEAHFTTPPKDTPLAGTLHSTSNARVQARCNRS